jgi:hypothetical protein
MTIEAVVNQFGHLLENDGKGTEGYEGYLYFRSFSVVFAQLTELIHLCFNRAKEPTSQSRSPSVSSVIFRMFRCFSSGLILADFRYRTLEDKRKIDSGRCTS